MGPLATEHCFTNEKTLTSLAQGLTRHASAECRLSIRCECCDPTQVDSTPLSSLFSFLVRAPLCGCTLCSRRCHFHFSSLLSLPSPLFTHRTRTLTRDGSTVSSLGVGILEQTCTGILVRRYSYIHSNLNYIILYHCIILNKQSV